MKVVESAVTITRRARPKDSALTWASVSPASSAMHLAAGEGGEVAEVVDAPVAEAGRPHRDGLQRLVLVVGTSIPSAEPSTFSARMTSGRGAFMT